MDIQVSEKLILFVSFLPIFLISLAVHEFSHAFIAHKYGDNTAKDHGRLTFNPFKHLDLIGSVAMPVLSFFSGFMLIGWAKPVPVNRSNLRNPLLDDAKVSVAGPISNFILSILCFLLLILFDKFMPESLSLIKAILWLGVYFNIFLFAFNLLPIPPLDGSHILFDIFPNKYTAKFLNLGFMGTILLFVFIYSPLWGLFIKFINLILGIFENIRASI